MSCAAVWVLLVSLAAARSPAPDTRAAARPTGTGFELQEVDEATWMARTRETLGARLRIDPTELRFSPSRQKVALLRAPPPGRKVPARGAASRYRIEVTDVEGKRRRTFRPLSARGGFGTPTALAFLGEDRLVYEVSLPPPAEPLASKATTRAKTKANTKAKAKAKAAARAKLSAKTHRAEPAWAAGTSPSSPPPPLALPPPLPTRLFVIQPLGRARRPIRCEGRGFGFTPSRDRVAFVTGPPAAAHVAVDGLKVYPRGGTGPIPSDVAWSTDGLGLAFVELAAGSATRPSARLVMLADLEDPAADTSWDLPATVPLGALHVFWPTPDEIVVGKDAGTPLFKASFSVQRPGKSR